MIKKSLYILISLLLLQNISVKATDIPETGEFPLNITYGKNIHTFNFSDHIRQPISYQDSLYLPATDPIVRGEIAKIIVQATHQMFEEIEGIEEGIEWPSTYKEYNIERIDDSMYISTGTIEYYEKGFNYDFFIILTVNDDNSVHINYYNLY